MEQSKTKNPKMIRSGAMPNKALFLRCVDEWVGTQNETIPSRWRLLAGALGCSVNVFQRAFNNPKSNYCFLPWFANKVEDLLGQPRGTFGGVDESKTPEGAFPIDGLQPVEGLDADETPTDAAAPVVPDAVTVVPEPPVPPRSKAHTVPSVLGADLEEPMKDMVNAGWRLIPLDQLGEWGHALIKLMDPFFKQRAAGNQIPVLIEHAANFDTIVITVPVPYGERKSVVVPSALHKRLIDSCKIISGQEAVYLIADMFTAYSAAKVEEIKSQALGRAAMQDQLVVRQHIGDLETMVGDMGPLGTALRDVEHDVSVALGRDHATATELLNLVDKYDTLRQEFRSLMRLIQGHITK